MCAGVGTAHMAVLVGAASEGAGAAAAGAAAAVRAQTHDALRAARWRAREL